MHSCNEFYLVLPSDASKNMHPNNTPSHFNVSWDSSIELGSHAKWKVALTEMSYVYRPHTVSSNLSITYEKLVVTKQEYNCTLRLTHTGKGFIVLDGTPLDMRVELDGNHHFVIYSKTLFYIHAVEAGYDDCLATWDEHSQSFSAVTNKPYHNLDGQLVKDFLVTLHIYFYENVIDEFEFPEDMIFASATPLANYLAEKCTSIFQNIEVSPVSKKFQFQFSERVHKVTLNQGLNFILGFYNNVFTSQKTQLMTRTLQPYYDNTLWKADVSPELNRGIKNMYIYASCCSPSYIGNKFRPLLKHVFNEQVRDGTLLRHGYVRNVAVYKPLYMDVSTTSINKIEIKICNNADRIVSLPQGSTTILTLHFKKEFNIFYKLSNELDINIEENEQE